MVDLNNDIMQKQLARIDELTALLSEQAVAIQALTELVSKLSAENALLKERSNKNSSNSSKPPSSDGLQKPAPKSLRKPSGKKQGGQKGHEGTGFSITQSPDKVIDHVPAVCDACPNYGSCRFSNIAGKRYEIDIIVQTKVIQHRALSFPCAKEKGKILTGTFPAHITTAMQYGNNLKAFAVALNTGGMVSIKRTHDILSAVFGVPISTGTIHSMVRDCADKIQMTVERIRKACVDSVLCHFDETGTRVDKQTMWVHNASNERYTYLAVSQKRGQIGMDECNVLPDFKGIAVHDCWKSYWKYGDIQHAVCGAHLLRELTGVMENHPEQTWAKEMLHLLMRMKQVRDRAVGLHQESLSCYYLHQFDREYQRIVASGRAENPIQEKTPGKRGRQAKGKTRALVERLNDYKESVCLFTRNFIVPFDNNQAERDVRMVKVKTKVSGCFRTKEGADAFAKIMSYLGTANKRKINSFLAIKQALLGQSDFIFR